MAIQFNRKAYDKVFNDLERFKDFCRFNLDNRGGFFPFNEKDLYNNSSYVWRAFAKTNRNYKGKRNKH
jgi:hypothetical protein